MHVGLGECEWLLSRVECWRYQTSNTIPEAALTAVDAPPLWKCSSRTMAATPGAIAEPVVGTLLRWNPGMSQGIDDCHRLRVRAIEHSDVREGERRRRSGTPVNPARVERAVRQATDQLVDCAYHEICLVRRRRRRIDADLRRLGVELRRIEAATRHQR